MNLYWPHRNEARRRRSGAALKMDFTQGQTQSFGSELTYSGGANGTYIDQNGTLQVSGTDTARFTHDSTGASLGLLIEEQRINICLQATDFGTTWTTVDTTVTVDNIISPDGTQNADLLTEGTAGTATTNQIITATADANYATGRFVKYGNNQWVFFDISNGANFVRGWFDVQNGVAGSTTVGGTGALVSIEMEDVGSGWYRCKLVGSVGSAATAITYRTFGTTADLGTGRVNSATRYEWGAMFEDNASFVSSFIYTTTTAVTRTADVATIALSSIPGFSATEGTVVATVQMLPGSFPNAAASVFVQIDDGTSDNGYFLQTRAANLDDYSNRIRVSAANEFIDDLGDPDADTPLKVALAYKTNDASSVANGVIIKSDTSVTLPTGLTTMRIGADSVPSQFLNGTIASLTYYNTRQPNEFLQAITS